jgi:hypothetical protein
MTDFDLDKAAEDEALNVWGILDGEPANYYAHKQTKRDFKAGANRALDKVLDTFEDEARKKGSRYQFNLTFVRDLITKLKGEK